MKSFFLLISALFASSSFADVFYDKLLAKQNLKSSDQAYCTEIAGEVEGSRTLAPMKMASVTKLFITLASLDKLGADYRFKTKFYYNPMTRALHINGGSDPFFVSENLLLVASLLRARGIHQLSSLSFDDNFLLNWSEEKTQISKTLLKFFNSSRWDGELEEMLTLSQKEVFLRKLPYQLKKYDFQLSNAQMSLSQNLESYQEIFQIRSNPLFMQLKMMNLYSNNFMAMTLFAKLGGRASLSDYFKESLDVTQAQLLLYNGAGFDPNFSTCEAIIKMLKRLEVEILEQNLQLPDLLSVAGIDEGTLQGRFKVRAKGRVLAKTGTLTGVSTLAGYYYNGNTYDYFAILNSNLDANKGHLFQDALVMHLFTPNLPIEYLPKTYFPLSDLEIE